MKTLSLAAVLCSCVAIGVADDRTDTTRTYEAPEVVVTATRTPISASDSPSPIEVVTMDDIHRSNGSTIADLLRSSTGMFLNDYGGEGALKTISVRGLPSQHLLILVDGQRLNSFQNGIVDLSLISLSNVEKIEIVRGGGSALYGTDAVGGVVNILTRRSAGVTHVRSELSAGSFGFQKYLVETETSAGIVNLVAGYMDEKGRDDYSFLFTPPPTTDTTLRRTNADFHRRQVYLTGSMLPDSRSSVSLSVQGVAGDRGAPGPVFSAGASSLARQSDDEIYLLARFDDRHVDGVGFEVQAGFRYNLQRYVDPDVFFPINSYYRNRFVSVNPQIRFTLGSTDQIVLGAEFAEGGLDGNDFDSRITRSQQSFYISNESHFSFQRVMFDRLSFYQAVRYDNISDVAYALTPRVGMNLRISQEGEIHLRASLGQNFRAPTFNDMYYRGFSNPALRPERSTSFDAGVTGEGDFGGLQIFEITYFHLDTENRILFDLATFMPVNIGRAVSRGIEFSYRGQFLDDLIRLGFNYTFTDARKRNRSSDTDSTYNQQLVFVPKHLARISASIDLSPFTVNLSHTIVGSRYTREDNAAFLEPYRTTNANVMVSVLAGSWNLTGKIGVDNLFDYSYEVFPTYPMPGRHYRVTLTVGG